MRLIGCALALSLLPCASSFAQDSRINELKGKIFDARMAEKTFADGLRHCDELDGKSFYLRVRNRILNLEEYLRSLESLAKSQSYNPEKRRPWSLQDAKEKWEQVKKEAEQDKQTCELVKSLPQLEKQLQDLENSAATSNADASQKKN
jgi:tRNA nucleotidyltransferase/poly(A) polymerase